MLLRRGTQGVFVNGVITDFATGIDVDDQQTFDGFTNGDLVVESILVDSPEPFATDGDGVPAFSASVVARDNSLVDLFFPGSAEASITPTQVAAADQAFFGANIGYIGAFGPTEDVDNSWANCALPGTLFDEPVVECPTGTASAGNITVAATNETKLLCQIDGTNAITTDLRLTNGDNIVYELVNPVFIGVDRGADPAAPLAGSASATLTIDAGVTVVSEGNDDYLVVARGSRILSNGTAANPVVFTAKGVLDGTITTDSTTKGIWGGLVINGRAPINDCADATAVGGTVDCEKSGEGASGFFGGATSDDDSGQLFYTRVEYAGVRLTNTDELNGIAFQGVGSGTDVSYVQVYNNLDDCFEFFGGTVSADHVVALGCGDDSLDWTDGWQGSLQYAIVYPGEGDMSGDPRGIEGDNQRPNDLQPVSTPRLSNFTIINSGDVAVDAGAVLRRGMAGTISNGIIVGFDDGIDVDDQATIDNITNGTLELRSIFLDNVNNFRNDSDNPPAPAAGDNIVEGTNTLSGFTFRAGRPGVVPGANEAAVPAYDVTGIGTLSATTYVGAVEDANDTWFRGWTVDEDGNVTN